MRVKRIVLKHHGNVARAGFYLVHAGAIDAQFAMGDGFQPGDHAQNGGFATARGAHQDHKFTILNNGVNVTHRAHIACVGFAKPVKF